jgi:hypothetical protein
VSKPRKDRIREERIRNEAVVDAYRPEEQALGWYYYLENKISFLFSARCIASKVVSPLRKGESVQSTIEAIGDWHYWVAQGYCF